MIFRVRRHHILLWSLLLFSCSRETEDPQLVVQVSTIDALMQGVFDGNTPLSDLSGWGDFGIGTFHALNGELILLDGSFYQIKADGKIYRPEKTGSTPFATVTWFDPEQSLPVSALTYAGLKSKIENQTTSVNLFYAIKVHGRFNRVKTRSVHAQQKPYPTLQEATASQPEFEQEAVTGTLSGFYCPPFVTGINVPGYHLHFLSDDHSFGGHVLELEIEKGTLWLDQISNFKLILPDNGAFLDTDLTDDLTDELEEVEGS